MGRCYSSPPSKQLYWSILHATDHKVAFPGRVLPLATTASRTHCHPSCTLGAFFGLSQGQIVKDRWALGEAVAWGGWQAVVEVWEWQRRQY